MSSLSYENVYSRFLSKVTAYDFLDLNEVQLSEFLCNWLHSSISKPYIRKLFARSNGISLNDEVQIITYKMYYVVDEYSDAEFLTEVLAYGMIISWLSPKIMSITNIAQAFLSSEEKMFSQAAHLSELQSLLDSSIKHQRSLISDRGYIYNTYLDNE